MYTLTCSKYVYVSLQLTLDFHNIIYNWDIFKIANEYAKLLIHI